MRCHCNCSLSRSNFESNKIAVTTSFIKNLAVEIFYAKSKKKNWHHFAPSHSAAKLPEFLAQVYNDFHGQPACNDERRTVRHVYRFRNHRAAEFCGVKLTVFVIPSKNFSGTLPIRKPGCHRRVWLCARVLAIPSSVGR